MSEEKKIAEPAPADEALPGKDANAFLESLSEMQASDFSNLRREPKKKKKSRKKGGLLSTLLLIVCVVVFLYCGWQIIYSIKEDFRSDSLYDDYLERYRDAMEPDVVDVLQLDPAAEFTPMKTYAQIAEEGADIIDPSQYLDNRIQSKKLQKMLVFLAELRGTNPDTYGYISVAGTRINYPVVQGKDNDFYLIHGFDGDSLKSGSIFADWRNSRLLTDNWNTVLYGHNMSTGAMFHDLTNYLNEDFFNNNQIVITTFDGIYTYEVFSIHESLANENYFQIWFSDASEFIAFCELEESLSKFHKEGVVFDENSRILTLSTCINNGNYEGRYALHALLVKTER